MGRFLSVSCEQLRMVDEAAMVLPTIEARTMLKFHVLCALEHSCGRRAVSDEDVNRAIARALKVVPVPVLALLEGAA